MTTVPPHSIYDMPSAPPSVHMQPSYYVRHPDNSYSLADPQPILTPVITVSKGAAPGTVLITDEPLTVYSPSPEEDRKAFLVFCKNNKLLPYWANREQVWQAALEYARRQK